MKKYILVYEVYDYPDMGGGTYDEYFETLLELNERLDKLPKENKEARGWEIKFIGEILRELKAEKKEFVIKYKIKT